MAWISFLRRLRWRTSCARRASRRRRARGLFVGQPGALQHAGRQQLGQGAGVAAVGLGLGVGDGVQLAGAGPPRRGPRAVPGCGRWPGRCRWSPGPPRRRRQRLWASSSSSSGVEGTRPAERSWPPSLIATSQKSRWTSMPIARMGALLSLRSTAVESRRANRHRRIRARSTPGCSRRGGHRQDRARSSRQIAACPSCVLPGSPRPGRCSLQRALRRGRAEASRGQFHGRTKPECDAQVPARTGHHGTRLSSPTTGWAVVHIGLHCPVSGPVEVPS